MTNKHLLAGLIAAALPCAGFVATAQGGRTVSLETLFELAETTGAWLRPSIAAEQEARREEDVARSRRLPDINANLSVSYLGDGFTTKRNFSDYQKAPIPHLGNGLSVGITQPIYAGGAITAGIEMARLKSTAARQATELSRDNIRMRLTSYYLDIYKCTNLRGVVEANIAQARKVLAEMHARHDQGTALQNDITRYELLVSNLELQLVKLDNTLAILNSNLAVTAGLPEGTVIEPDTTILARALPRKGEAWWQQEAAANSPSLMLARSGADISRKAETLARSERLPHIGLQAGWSLDGPILVEVPPINRNLSYWYVGVGVSYNLSSLFKSNKTLARSRAATVRADAELEVAREQLELDVRADHVRYLEAYEELKTREKSVELAERNYRVTSTRYNADMALITDMLDAANSKLEAEQQLVNARIDIIYYYYKLLFVSGKI